LESVRSDLVHLNSEKKERLIYSIEKYLRDPDLDRNEELSGVLKKVIKLVEQYVAHRTLLFKPKRLKKLY
jgi:LytS/YehU family sensor histidine kinase